MPQKYPKPPIVEAILQLRYGSALTKTKLNRLTKLLRPAFPKVKPEIDLELAFEIKDGGTSASQAKPNAVDEGARLISADDQRTIVTRRKSLLFAHHAPYPGWDQFLAGAQRVFGLVREKIGYRTVEYVGLRYTNRIDVPLGESQLMVTPSDYMVVGPALPAISTSSSVRTYQLVADIDLGVDKLVARIQAATLDPALINHASLLLDIDVISRQDVPQTHGDMWALVGRMRNAKNDIFEACITDRARKLFGWNP